MAAATMSEAAVGCVSRQDDVNAAQGHAAPALDGGLQARGGSGVAHAGELGPGERAAAAGLVYARKRALKAALEVGQLARVREFESINSVPCPPDGEH